MKQAPSTKNQRGFAVAPLLLAVALIGVLMAGFAMASRGTSSNANTESVKVNAGLLLKQATDYRDAASRYMADGMIVPVAAGTEATDFLDPTKDTALTNTTRGYAIVHTVPAAAMAGGSAGAWTFNPVFVGTDVGGAGKDPAMEVVGVSDNLCRRINNMIYSDTMTGAIPTTLASGRTEGCWNNGTKNVYFKVIAEN